MDSIWNGDEELYRDETGDAGDEDWADCHTKELQTGDMWADTGKTTVSYRRSDNGLEVSLWYPREIDLTGTSGTKEKPSLFLINFRQGHIMCEKCEKCSCDRLKGM